MTAYYSENDPKTAAWLRELIREGVIARGEVDERSIVDVVPSDLKGFTQHHFFAGIGGWSYALRLAGWPDRRPVWTGSCPCQPFSQTGKLKGFKDDRHLWPHWARLIRKQKPAAVLGEQVTGAAAHQWLDLVFTDLERWHYACAAADLCAAGVAAPHQRQRLYWVAYANGSRPQGLKLRQVRGAVKQSPWARSMAVRGRDGAHRLTKPGTRPLANGIPGRVGLIRGYGNAIVPQLAARFIRAAVSA